MATFVRTLSSMCRKLTERHNGRWGLIFTKFQQDMKVTAWKWISWTYRRHLFKAYSPLSGLYGSTNSSWGNCDLKSFLDHTLTMFCNLLNWIFCVEISTSRSKSLKEKEEEKRRWWWTGWLGEEIKKEVESFTCTLREGHLLGRTAPSYVALDQAPREPRWLAVGVMDPSSQCPTRNSLLLWSPVALATA